MLLDKLKLLFTPGRAVRRMARRTRVLEDETTVMVYTESLIRARRRFLVRVPKAVLFGGDPRAVSDFIDTALTRAPNGTKQTTIFVEPGGAVLAVKNGALQEELTIQVGVRPEDQAELERRGLHVRGEPKKLWKDNDEYLEEEGDYTERAAGHIAEFAAADPLGAETDDPLAAARADAPRIVSTL